MDAGKRTGSNVLLHGHRIRQGLYPAVLFTNILPGQGHGRGHVDHFRFHPRLLVRLRLSQPFQLPPHQRIMEARGVLDSRMHRPPVLLFRPGRPGHRHRCRHPGLATAHAEVAPPALEAEDWRCLFVDHGWVRVRRQHHSPAVLVSAPQRP